MEVCTVNLASQASAQREQWRTYVDSAPQATFYHTLAWLDAIDATFRHRPWHLAAYRDGEVAGVLPLYEVRSFLAGKILVSVPYAVYGGVLADDEQAAQALFSAAKNLADERDCRYLDVRSARAMCPDLAVTDRYVRFVKQLPGNVKDVVATFPRKARAEARKARDRYRLRECFDNALLPEVWDLYSRSMRRLGSPNMPFRFFENLAGDSNDHYLVSAIVYRDKPIAGLLSLIHRDTIMPYYSGCRDRVAKSYGANNLLYLSLMEKAVELGLSRFDFGRTRKDNTGSYNFKKNQGFEPQPLAYQFYMPQGGALPNLTPSNKKFRFAQWMWQRLPLPVTQGLGGWLSSAIPG